MPKSHRLTSFLLVYSPLQHPYTKSQTDRMFLFKVHLPLPSLSPPHSKAHRARKSTPGRIHTQNSPRRFMQDVGAPLSQDLRQGWGGGPLSDQNVHTL